MALLDILEYPDTRLRSVAKPVAEVNDEIRKIVDDMLETMYHAQGVGLAATQVDIHQQIVVMDMSEEGNDPLVLINPSFEGVGEDKSELQEGCLSVPGFYELLDRFGKVRLTALNRDGEEYAMELDGLAAVCVQHELDHLKGKLFIDALSRMKQDRIRKKLEKNRRLASA